MDNSETFAHIEYNHRTVFCKVLHLFIVDGQNLNRVCSWFLVITGFLGVKNRAKLPPVETANLCWRACAFAKLCLEINSQVTIYGHPLGTGRSA